MRTDASQCTYMIGPRVFRCQSREVGEKFDKQAHDGTFEIKWRWLVFLQEKLLHTGRHVVGASGGGAARPEAAPLRHPCGATARDALRASGGR